MEKRVIVATPDRPQEWTLLPAAFKEGWELDEEVYQSGGRAQPLRLDNAVVYHLVKYTEYEKAAREKAAEEALLPPQERKVVDRVKLSDQEEIRVLLSQGWTIVNEWAKETLLYLYEAEVKNVE